MSSRGRISVGFRKAYQRFVVLRGTPREIALGFALGLFVGMSPYLGFGAGGSKIGVTGRHARLAATE